MAPVARFGETQQPSNDCPARDPDRPAIEDAESDRVSVGSNFSIETDQDAALGQMTFSPPFRQCSVDSTTVLHRGGAVLSNLADEQKYDSFSEELDAGDRYDYFISHNWSVRRWRKYLALCLIWSRKSVLVACCLAQLLAFLLVATGVLPVLTSQVDGHEFSIWCIGACMITYALVYFLKHDLLRLLKCRGYRIFLDKVCVDQSSEAQKQKGIDAITAFLYHSDAMIVLFSEVYLTRLWTVYELTTFIALKPTAKLIIQPVILGPAAVYIVAIQILRVPEVFLVPLTWDGFATMDPPLLTLALLLMAMQFLCLFVGAYFIRIWGITRADMKQQIQAFTLEKAKCHNPEDRLRIMAAIKKFARQEGITAAKASTGECAKSFETMVQNILPKKMESAFLLSGIPCEVASLMALPAMALVLDASAIRLRSSAGSAMDFGAELMQDLCVESCMPIFIGLAGICSFGQKDHVGREVLRTTLCFVLLWIGLWLPASPFSVELLTVIPVGLKIPVSACFLTVEVIILLCIYIPPWFMFENLPWMKNF